MYIDSSRGVLENTSIRSCWYFPVLASSGLGTDSVQYTTVHYSAVQCSAVQYSAVQYSILQCSTVYYSAVQYTIVQYSTVQCSDRGLGDAPRGETQSMDSHNGWPKTVYCTMDCIHYVHCTVYDGLCTVYNGLCTVYNIECTRIV